MAIEYRLTMAGDIPLDQIAESAMPDPTDRPTPAEKQGLLSADLLDQRGFILAVRHGRNGYYEADDNGASWEWEPDTYLNVTFRMAKEGDVNAGVRNMLNAVSRLLISHTADAALILNGDALLLTRLAGTLRKHSRALWWDHHGFVNEIVPG
ncbi:SitI3 family protein [Plantactinospora sp. CA-290183]|uniref:SitI3 family protein n=1 Tax=Plantactinospora sp. CA-290183 TaxID=3240006 RepID=UPI003D92C9C3